MQQLKKLYEITMRSEEEFSKQSIHMDSGQFKVGNPYSNDSFVERTYLPFHTIAYSNKLFNMVENKPRRVLANMKNTKNERARYQSTAQGKMQDSLIQTEISELLKLND